MHYNAASDEVWGENEIDHVLVVKKDVEYEVNPEEVAEARYFTMEEVFQVVLMVCADEVAAGCGRCRKGEGESVVRQD